MTYLVFLAVWLLVIIGSLNVDVEKITPWLLGVNFTLAIFSINFTLFGQQLSKYKAIYGEVSRRQWANIVVLIAIPFVPLICFMILPEYFGKSALWVMPLLMFSAIDNAFLTKGYLTPTKFIEDKFSDREISKYLGSLSRQIKKDVDDHEKYVSNRDKFQIPLHGHSFEPTTLGVEVDDAWDSIAMVVNLAVENNDYPIFRKAIDATLRLTTLSYSYDSKSEDYRVNSGVTKVARKRMRAVVAHITDKDASRIFLQSLSNELCRFLMKDELLDQPCSDMATAIASDVVWIGMKMLSDDDIIEPIKVLNTLHGIVELGIIRVEHSDSEEAKRTLDVHNIAVYAYYIKSLGVAAFEAGNSHFAYRCMETLSYLGCNAAKIKSSQTVIAVLESLVQLGRVARSLKIGCFWTNCLIPVESHAEEFIGHILTWLVLDLDSDGDFFMKGYAEQSYSRLRGVKCVIEPVAQRNPIFWVKEVKKGDQTVPHIEHESGMYGYTGQCDYSDFSNLKEYVLHGISGSSEARIFRSYPIPLNIDDCEESDD